MVNTTNHSIHAEASLHDSSLATCQRGNMQGTSPLKVPNHLQNPLQWKLLNQGSSLLVEKLERNTDVCEAHHFGLKDALAIASCCPGLAVADAVLDAVCHALQRPEVAAAAHIC